MAPEVRGEDPVAVGHDVGWQAVEAVDAAEEEAGNVGRSNRGLGRDEMGHLGETVDHDKDRIVLGWRWRQADNEIHGDRGPRSRRCL